MKVYGIFRGFPGLGRVMSGLSILNILREEGHEVKAYSYMQGLEPIQRDNIDLIIMDEVDKQNVTSIGLNPVGRVAEKLINNICEDKPDIIIIDGEPLLISTLAMVYPREKIIALLNPADIMNPSQPKSSLYFFRKHFLSAGNAIVHGINVKDIVIPNDTQGCKVLLTNTILRNVVINTIREQPEDIVCILGGGCNNASDSFSESTIKMGRRVIQAAEVMHEEMFKIYCNDCLIADRLNSLITTNNIKVESQYISPDDIYKNAKVVICRAGRNTISEILYLKIPAILMSTSGDFRSVEQEKNMDQVCELRPGMIMKSYINENVDDFINKIKAVCAAQQIGNEFIPGNEQVLLYILQI